MRKTVDLLLENGRIYTMVSEGDCVEALCVKDGVIVYTGTAAEAERLYDAAEVVDLGGRVMLPGMGRLAPALFRLLPDAHVRRPRRLPQPRGGHRLT